MLRRISLGLLLSGLALAAGCAEDGGPMSAANGSADGGTGEFACDGSDCRGGLTSASPDGAVGRPARDPNCQPRECRDNECGMQADGCGGSMNCGPCDQPECTKKTCADLLAECGGADDGCGGRLDCGTCAGGSMCAENKCSCTADESEANETKAAAFRIGEVRESTPETFRQINTLNLHTTGDNDWYRVRIGDEWDWDWGTPEIHVRVAGDASVTSHLQVTALFECEGGDELEQTCESSSPFTSEDGKGCQQAQAGASDLVMYANCAWAASDHGTMYLNVRSADGAAAACSAYTVRVEVL